LSHCFFPAGGTPQPFNFPDFQEGTPLPFTFPPSPPSQYDDLFDLEISTPPPTSTTEKRCCATFYSSCSFSGKEKLVCGNLDDFGPLLGELDAIRSMQIDHGCIVDAYKGASYTGDHHIFQSDIECILNSDYYLNAQFSSVKVQVQPDQNVQQSASPLFFPSDVDDDNIFPSPPPQGVDIGPYYLRMPVKPLWGFDYTSMVLLAATILSITLTIVACTCMVLSKKRKSSKTVPVDPVLKPGNETLA